MITLRGDERHYFPAAFPAPVLVIGLRSNSAGAPATDATCIQLWKEEALARDAGYAMMMAADRGKMHSLFLSKAGIPNEEKYRRPLHSASLTGVVTGE
jgi:hypothetical protein